jgi:hypothetical protein
MEVPDPASQAHNNEIQPTSKIPTQTTDHGYLGHWTSERPLSIGATFRIIGPIVNLASGE